MTCRSSGSDPPANVTWWRKGQLFDDTFEIDSNGVVINDLEIKKLTAQDLMSVLTCQASNTESVPPLEASILIDITSKSCIFLRSIFMLHAYCVLQNDSSSHSITLPDLITWCTCFPLGIENGRRGSLDLFSFSTLVPRSRNRCRLQNCIPNHEKETKERV